MSGEILARYRREEAHFGRGERVEGVASVVFCVCRVRKGLL